MFVLHSHYLFLTAEGIFLFFVILINTYDTNGFVQDYGIYLQGLNIGDSTTMH